MAIEKIFVLDTETSLHNNDVGKFLAHPASKDNWVVWLGVQELGLDLQDNSPIWLTKYPTIKEFTSDPVFDTSKTLLVGHNIGFDLLHLCNTTNKYHTSWLAFINHPDAMIWDTQLAAYRLSGQTNVSPSLDGEAERRGWPLKPGRLKEYWENGISTEDIPDNEVRPYLEHDVATTGKLFKHQLAEAAELGMLEMLRIEMKSRLTTIVMERNGMSFDQKQARIDCAAVLRPLREQAEKNATEQGMKLFGLPRAAVRANSPHFLKAVLYGGTVKWKEQLPMVDKMGNAVYFKSGKKKGTLKIRWTELQQEVPAVSPVDLKNTEDETLVKIIEHTRCPSELANFLEEVRAFRDGQKQEKTYFTGYSDLTWPDGMIHGNLNHAIAATGRLSSSNPNLQNAGHSPIRSHFKSRFEGGQLMEVDLSQIEVVVQAWLSQDTNMMDDIKHKVDFHCKRAAFAHGEKYDDVVNWCNEKTTKITDRPLYDKWTKIRKGAKIVSFQKAYGAGVNKISQTTGLTKNEVKAFMEAEDSNYPNVPKIQESWIEEVNRSTRIRDGRTCGILTSPINVQYRFFQDSFNGHATYKPTCIKNYPVQGFAADIIKILLAGLRKVIYQYNAQYMEDHERVLLVNTVHDSVILDIPPGVDANHLGHLLKEYFCNEPIAVLKNTFGVDFNAPISADVDVGSTWQKMETITC